MREGMSMTAGQCAPLAGSGVVSVMAWGFASSPRWIAHAVVETCRNASQLIGRRTYGPPRASVRQRLATIRFPRLLRGSIPAAAVAMVVALSACADKPAININGYCEVKESERIDMRDPGLQGLWPSNQGAVLTGDDNFRQLCQRTNQSPGGPR